jgi:hypothetical protein
MTVIDRFAAQYPKSLSPPGWQLNIKDLESHLQVENGPTGRRREKLSCDLTRLTMLAQQGDFKT